MPLSSPRQPSLPPSGPSLPSSLTLQPSHTTRVPKGKTPTGGRHVGAACHAPLARGAKVVQDDRGGSDQPTEVEELELAELGEEEDGGGEGGHAAEEHRLEQGDSGRWQGSKGTQVKDLELGVHADLAIPGGGEREKAFKIHICLVRYERFTDALTM